MTEKAPKKPYRRPPTRLIQPAPPEFAEEFVRGGWRRVERLYGARTDTLLKWIEMCGGQELHKRRAETWRGNSRGNEAPETGKKPR